MKEKMPVNSKKLLTVILMILMGILPVESQSEVGQDSLPAKNDHETESFDTGRFIFEHVLDAHEWHIATVGNRHISVPLPVILYTKFPELHGGKKFHVFLSSEFHHGHTDFQGFHLSTEEENKGRIVELDKQGQVVGRPIDLSITKSIAGAIVSVLVLFSLLFVAAHSARKNRGRAPSGIHNFVEPVVVFIRDEIAKPSIGEKNYKKFMSPLLTLFFFILLNNLLGLIPIFPFGANVTGNIAITMVLALFSFFVTNIKGSKHYWKEVFNPDVPLWLKFPIPLMPILEISGMITKPFVLMIRLFANMLAGHMIVTVFLSLIFIFSSLMGPAAGYGVSPVSIGFAVFITLLDVLVSFIQAYVFTLLSAIYFGMASAEHH